VAHLGSGTVHCSMLVRAYLEKVLVALEARAGFASPTLWARPENVCMGFL
jgi:hypothetical protein